MNTKTLLFLVAVLNIVMVFLLVHKQNKIIKALYELQYLQEQKEQLADKKKELLLQYHMGQKLSTLQTFAKDNLQLRPMTLKDAQAIPTPKETHE